VNRARRAVALLVVAAVAVTACSDDGDGEGEGADTATSRLVAETVPGGEVTIEVGGTDTAATAAAGPTTTIDPRDLTCPATDPGAEGEAAVLVAAACATDAVSSKRFDVSSTTGGGTISFGSAGTSDVSAGRADVTLQRQGVDSIRYVVDGDRVWFTSGLTSFSTALPDGKTWVAANVAEAQSLGVLDATAGGAPVHLLALGATDVVLDGDRYTFSVSPSAVLAAVPAARRTAVSQLLPLDQADLAVTGDAVVVDGRITDVTVTAIAGSTGTATVWEATNREFDVPVDIAPPPASAVVAFADVPDLPGVMASLTGA
jgi:hypothetical protein